MHFSGDFSSIILRQYFKNNLHKIERIVDNKYLA